ncbi:MAG: OmpH family outer membrane protein [Nitrospirota bacterium]
MKNVVLLLICLLVFPAFSVAADPAKIGVIDIQKVLNESEAGKKAKSDLETLIKSKQTVIDEKGKAIEKLKSELEKQASVLSAEARKNKEEELEKLVREYQRLVQDSQAEVKKREGELTDAILKEVHDLVGQIGEQENYSLVMERGLILYSEKTLDITNIVLKKYDESKAKSKKL